MECGCSTWAFIQISSASHHTRYKSISFSLKQLVFPLTVSQIIFPSSKDLITVSIALYFRIFLVPLSGFQSALYYSFDYHSASLSLLNFPYRYSNPKITRVTAIRIFITPRNWGQISKRFELQVIESYSQLVSETMQHGNINNSQNCTSVIYFANFCPPPRPLAHRMLRPPV